MPHLHKALTLPAIMKRLLIIYIILNFYCIAFGQKKNEKIVSAIDKKFYSFIPLSIFNDTTIIGVTSPFRIGSSKEITMYWISVCTDGYYNLTITPEQIYLTSSHENPNPNMLYWLIPINKITYSKIAQGFKTMNLLQTYYDSTYNDYKLLPQSWTDSTSLLFGNNCKIKTELQIDKMILLLNEFLKGSKNQIDKIQRIILKNSIYFGHNKQQIKDWKPKIFEVLKKE